MIITKNKHNRILNGFKNTHQARLDEIHEIIEDQEKQIELIVDRLSNKLEEIVNAKRCANKVLELLDYSSEDSVIPSIVNFLNEQGNTDAANIIGKCKLGRVSARQGEITNYIYIPILCTGDAYNILFEDEKTEAKQIQQAFETFYSDYYIRNSTNMKINRFAWGGVTHELQLTMKQLEPKESDLEQFFMKVAKLKNLIDKE